MTPEKLTEELKNVCPAGLKSVILYGSAVAGDHAGKRSDYNVLVVAEELGIEMLDAILKPASIWAKAGNPPPLLFTEERLAQATDVFPVELLDIRDCHRVLHGGDPLAGLEIDAKNLRLQIEHELRGKLIKLRQSYLTTQGRSRAVADLMIHSLSSFLVLFRAALRLFEDQVPQKKMDALAGLAGHLKIDTGIFQSVQDLKDETKKIKDVAVGVLFNDYLRAVECVVDAVDAYIHQGE